MNPTGKKFISLFLVFSLVMLSVNLYAKERRGAKLRVAKKDGQQVEGELITVKPNSLLLLNNEGKDVSVDIADIKVIRVVKKSKAVVGFLVGACLGAILGAIGYQDSEPGTGEGLFTRNQVVVLLAITGGLCGGWTGAQAGKDKTFQIEGMTDLEKRKVLDKLRKKARIRDYK
jgi:hypothetical protein